MTPEKRNPFRVEVDHFCFPAEKELNRRSFFNDMNDLGFLPLVLKVLDVDPLPFVKLSIGI